MDVAIVGTLLKNVAVSSLKSPRDVANSQANSKTIQGFVTDSFSFGVERAKPPFRRA